MEINAIFFSLFQEVNLFPKVSCADTLKIKANRISKNFRWNSEDLMMKT